MTHAKCPKCGYPLGKQPIPDAPVKTPKAPIKEYALELKYAVKRRCGGFV